MHHRDASYILTSSISIKSLFIPIIFFMSAEAPRQTVKLTNNGSSFDLPVPFRPQDNINLSSLYPHSMIMILYTEQIIAAVPHGSNGQKIVVYPNGHTPQK